MIVEEFLNQALGGNKMYKAWQLANFGLIVKRMKKEGQSEVLIRSLLRHSKPPIIYKM